MWSWILVVFRMPIFFKKHMGVQNFYLSQIKLDSYRKDNYESLSP